MSRLCLHRSNRAEHLAAALAEVISVPLGAALQREIVVVQSAGMSRWLSLEMARRLGVCANLEFPFPQKLVADLFALTLPEFSREDAFSRPVLTWRVHHLLPTLWEQPAFASVRHYAQGANADLKLFQLSEKIALLYDQYLAFRPEMILRWQQGEDAAEWQAILWRELVRGRERQHLAACGEAFAREVKRAKNLPERISIFGISSLPPFYLDLLGVLAERVEVHFFLLQPTPLYFGTMLSEKQERRQRRETGLSAQQLLFDDKNSLLASLGQLGRDFQNLLLEKLPDAEELEGFERPESGTMLEQLQQDFYELTDAGTPHAVATDDASLQLNSCHSPLREMEVLRDQLLRCFETLPGLQPKDVVVMMPDVETYAPFIEAVFGVPESEATRLPFTIADRLGRAANAPAETFLKILEVAQSRLTVGDVLGVLESPEVRRRFELGEADWDSIRTWLNDVTIRWGMDAEHRGKLGLPKSAQNTWRAGLDRLILGLALPGREEQLFAGILPYDHIEGKLAETLGQFAAFADRLFALAQELERERPLAAWQNFFQSLLHDFLETDEESLGAVQALRSALASLAPTATLAGHDQPVSLPPVAAFVQRLLAERDTGAGFLAGRITFCSLKPMRSIPFRVICLAGLNDGAFPRRAATLGFDKMTAAPRPGDRTPRLDDRHLFLEAMLSARDVFCLTYTGQSGADNSPIPPSVLVSELADYLDRHFALPLHNPAAKPTDAAVGRFAIKHRLQAFSREYFRPESPAWSYSEQNCQASRTSIRTRQDVVPFLAQPLPELPPEQRRVTLAQLVKFFENPSRAFLENRLQIRLSREEETLAEQEAFDLDKRDEFNIRNFFLRQKLAKKNLPVMEIVRAQGQLPAGPGGDALAQKIRGDAEKFLGELTPHLAGEPEPDLPFAETIGDWQVTGMITGVFNNYMLRYRCGKVREKDRLEAWIYHLALNCVRPGRRSLYVGTEDSRQFAPVAEAREILGRLIAFYAQGQREPLPFFPRTSLEFARRTYVPGGREKTSPLDSARKKWASSGDDWSQAGEEQDAAMHLCFRHREDPLDAAWENVAKELGAPFFAAEEKL